MSAVCLSSFTASLPGTEKGRGAFLWLRVGSQLCASASLTCSRHSGCVWKEGIERTRGPSSGLNCAALFGEPMVLPLTAGAMLPGSLSGLVKTIVRPAAVAWALGQGKAHVKRGTGNTSVPPRTGGAFPPLTQPHFPLLGIKTPRIKVGYRALWEVAYPTLASASRMYLRNCQGKDLSSTLNQFSFFQRQKGFWYREGDSRINPLATTAPGAGSLDPWPWLPFPSSRMCFPPEECAGCLQWRLA